MEERVHIGPANPIGTAVLVLALAAWLVAMGALLRMVFAAFMDPERRSLLWLLSLSMPLASYDRNNLRIFAACILFMVAMVILLNVLALTGYIKI
jgi:hypothetical protein